MIKILPYEHFTKSSLKPHFINDNFSVPFLKDGQNRHFFLPNAKTAIKLILSSLNFKKTDEVYITNSTDQTYISSCVTCTIFNFCQPSRILTENTRAIFIIHEYGVPHPKLLDLIREGKNRSIPVIEDCAHTFDSQVNNQWVGTFGDYAIYSLPKILPMKKGGVLYTRKSTKFDLSEVNGQQTEKIRTEFTYFIRFLTYFSQRRKQNFKVLNDLFQENLLLFHLKDNITPYFFGVFLGDNTIIRHSNSSIEWGSTLEKNLILIPTNPLINSDFLLTKTLENIKIHE